MKSKQLTLSALLTTLLFISSYFRFPLGFIPPITLQTFFVILIGLILPAKLAFLVTSINALCQISLQGLLSSPQLGFVIGFIATATTLAFLIKLSKRLWYICLCSLISSSFIYIIGIPYFIILTNHASHYFSNNIIHTLLNIINVFVLPYIIGDIIKAGIAILVARQFHDLKTKIDFYN